MPKPKKETSYSWVLGPSEELQPLYPPYPYYCCRPPVCTPPLTKNWRELKGANRETVEIEVRKDEMALVVSRWVEQLVRKEIGPWLAEAEKKAKRRLSIAVSADAALLVDQALRKKDKAGYGA